MEDNFINNSWGNLAERPEIPPQPLNQEMPPVRQSTKPPIAQELDSAPTESELAKKTPLWLQFIKGLALFIGTFILIYLFLTFPAQWQKIKYFVSHLGRSSTPQTISLPAVTDDSTGLFLSSIQQALENVPEKKPEVKPVYSLDISDLENNTLLIPKINIKVPIVWNSPPDEKTMLANLQNGVVHYNGTGLPSQPDGNVFISGHSSYYWWDKGKYKTVFATLDNVAVGDEMALAYENQAYIYRVYEKSVVKPEQIEILQSVGKPILSLMTCVPVGTNLKRLVVKAERIDVTSRETKETPQSTPTSTPTPTATYTPIEQLWNLVPWLN